MWICKVTDRLHHANPEMKFRGLFAVSYERLVQVGITYQNLERNSGKYQITRESTLSIKNRPRWLSNEVTADVSRRISKSGKYLGVAAGYDFEHEKGKKGLRYSY